jgi:hydroxyacylglutathione hydrolase
MCPSDVLGPRAAAGGGRDSVRVETFVVGPLQSNSYLVVDEGTRRAAVVDPGMESEPVLEAVRAQGLRLDCLIATHAHFDHVAGSGLFKAATGAAIVMHPEDLPLLAIMPETARLFGFRAADPPRPDRLVREGDVVAVGELRLGVLETPGHTPGSISLRGDGAVFVGDTLFAGSVGRTDLAGGSQEDLLRSIRNKLLTLPDMTVVYSGHGPPTTIGSERRNNPFLRDGW